MCSCRHEFLSHTGILYLFTRTQVYNQVATGMVSEDLAFFIVRGLRWCTDKCHWDSWILVIEDPEA